jgi:hypothetical protein
MFELTAELFDKVVYRIIYDRGRPKKGSVFRFTEDHVEAEQVLIKGQRSGNVFRDEERCYAIN